ncbi:hypothetical protein [Leifsonia sp. A12D58]|uniref:hypothetical protein n=1 Tax=Leifsonia sp. A12D58 TaxID=3397674 RepID=UPI0039E19706
MSTSATKKTVKPNFLARLTPMNWIALVLFILTVIFIIQNTSTVSIDLLWISVRSPQWLTISVIFLIGWLCGYFTRRRKNSKD